MTPGSDSLEYPVRQLLYCAAGQAAYTWVWRRETQRQGTGALRQPTGWFAGMWTPAAKASRTIAVFTLVFL